MPQTKMAVWGGLTHSCEEKRSENRGEKERYTHLNAEFQRIARRDKKDFFSDQYKEIEEKKARGSRACPSSRPSRTAGARRGASGRARPRRSSGRRAETRST